MSQATTLARVIIRQILEAGITDAVISPGSRNAPLSLALVAAQKRGLIKLHIRIDERTAAFYALGLAKASNRPVPVICTSGTAVANYHPAVLEASHSNIPLFVITADRPAELRLTGANQTTEQARIFGKAVRYFSDVSGGAYPLELPLNALQTGPVHINVQFEEPLLGDDNDAWLEGLKVNPPKVFDRKKAGTLATKSTRGLLVIGHDRGGLEVAAVGAFIESLGWPVISEDPLTFAQANAHASLFLTSTTIAKWIAKWQKYSERSAKVVKDLSKWSEPLIAREIAANLPNETTIFIASSRPIRDLEAFASTRSGLTTYANRGLAGIDGNISTATGIATHHGSAVAVLGDLAFLHDLTGLIHHDQVNLKIYVVNNDGGGIFSTLPQRGVTGFEQVFGTPHGLDPAAIAVSMGISAKTIDNASDLVKDLTTPIKGLSVVVLRAPNREANADLIKELSEKMKSL
jgi:2-succinyl-5-enolpyruvyl-6-hydroxy-3-cyclohexene-1-carboxylate synthase